MYRLGANLNALPAFSWRERLALFWGVARTIEPAGCAWYPLATPGGELVGAAAM